jgi:hypothetical protein
VDEGEDEEEEPEEAEEGQAEGDDEEDEDDAVGKQYIEYAVYSSRKGYYRTKSGIVYLKYSRAT